MNPVHRQYFEMASLVGQRDPGCMRVSYAGGKTKIYQGVATALHSLSGHFTFFWTPMGFGLF